MNRDEIIRLAREAGLQHEEAAEEFFSLHYTGIYLDDLERFVALVAAAEREACAKIVEQYCGAWDDAGYALSQAIRERGQE